LLGDALDHFQHAADGLAVGGQLIDHAYRLIDLRCQPRNAALLGLHQATAADGFIVDAMGAAHRRRRAACHFLGGGGHLVHGRRHLFDLAALPGNRLVTAGRDRLDLAGLQLNLADGVPDALDQVVDLGHGAIEHLAQFAQLVAAAGDKRDGHIARRHLVHHRPQAPQRGTRRGIETGVQIKDQQKHRRQGRHQYDHVRAVLRQPLLQLLSEETQGGLIELVGLGHQLTHIVVEALPRCVEGFGHHHLLFKQFTALLEARVAGLGQAVERCVGGFAGAQGVLQLQAVFGLEFFQLLQQLVEARAGGGVEKTLAEGVRAHCPPFAQRLGDLRRDAGDQFAELAQITLGVAAQAGLAGDDLAEHLRLVQQFADQRTFAL